MTKQECIAHLNLAKINVYEGDYSDFLLKWPKIDIINRANNSNLTFIFYPKAYKLIKAVLYKELFYEQKSFTTYKDVITYAKKLREQQQTNKKLHN